jgi:DNA-binding PadR family transcriptional regulator
MSTERLTPTSYLVLGLLAREGPSTPYDLERHVGATLGNFWSFPHTLLYAEPQRLAAEGLVTESRDTGGRRRRVFTVTPAGLAALRAWMASAGARLRVAEQQLAIHRAKLSAYEEDARLERRADGSGRGNRTVEHWRGETLRMGLLYERAAVEFWAGVLDDARDRSSSG